MSQATCSEIILALVDDLPIEQVHHLAACLETEASLNWDRLLHLLETTASQIEAQGKLRGFIQSWRLLANPPQPAEMAHLLQVAAAALLHQRQQQRIELTWTGPKSAHIPLRRTDQALLELIKSARQRIVVVSFAVYKARPILAALEQAAARGVSITIIIESPEASEGQIAYSTLAALGSSLRACAQVFNWPHDQRPTAPDGRVGSLHAKVAVADGRHLFLSSANLTDYAMNLNMEMGVLVENRELATRVGQHFDQLIAQQVLVAVSQD